MPRVDLKARLNENSDRYPTRGDFNQSQIGILKQLCSNAHAPACQVAMWRLTDYDESAATFYGKQPWPGTAARFPKLLELGSGKHSELELNFGRRLGDLWGEN